MTKISAMAISLLKIVICVFIIVFSLRINIIESRENAFAVLFGALLIFIGDKIFARFKDRKIWLIAASICAFAICVLIKIFVVANVYVNVITFVFGIALASLIFL